MSEPMDKIRSFLDADSEKICKLISDYPGQLSVPVLAEFLGTTRDSVRSMIESGVFGAGWKKPGTGNRGFFIPTAQFVRWYLDERGIKAL